MCSVNVSIWSVNNCPKYSGLNIEYKERLRAYRDVMNKGMFREMVVRTTSWERRCERETLWERRCEKETLWERRCEKETLRERRCEKEVVRKPLWERNVARKTLWERGCEKAVVKWYCE